MNEALSKDDKVATALAVLEALRQQHDLVEDHAALGSAAAKGALAYLRRVGHPRFEEFIEELRAESVPNVDGLLKAVDRHEQDARKKRRARATTTAPAPSPNQNKKRIELDADDLTGALNAIEDALRTKGANLYQTNGRLVRLIHHNKLLVRSDGMEGIDEAPEATRRPHGALVMIDVGEALLTELMSQCATFWKFHVSRKGDNPNEKGDWVNVSPPPTLARYVLARGEWALLVLRGTVEAPTLRGDGSILAAEGYDAEAELFLDTNGVVFPPIPDDPTMAEAKAALATLNEAISTFPFVPDEGGEWGDASAARSVMLSAMLTAIIRRSMRTAPAHAIVAPTPGTGKTKLAEMVSALATGRTATAVSYGKSQEEFEKRLFSVLLAGDSVVLIDNIEADEIASDEFCTVLTSETVKNWILGLSKMSTVPTNATFLLNGNNIVFRGDVTDRVVMCSLDARVEDPKARVFDREPVAYVLAHRPALVAAALTVMRAHVVAGYPGLKDLVPSRFPDWDRMVRGALVWLGEPDPQETRIKVAAIDPVRDMHAALVRTWWNATAGSAITAQQLIDRAMAADDEEELAKFKWHDAGFPDVVAGELRDALGDAVEGKALSAKRLSTYLMKFQGRVSDGLAIRARQDRKLGNRFWLEAV